MLLIILSSTKCPLPLSRKFVEICLCTYFGLALSPSFRAQNSISGIVPKECALHKYLVK